MHGVKHDKDASHVGRFVDEFQFRRNYANEEGSIDTQFFDVCAEYNNHGGTLNRRTVEDYNKEYDECIDS